MNHDEWVRQELEGLSQSLGFQYTPIKEIENRITKMRRSMEKKEIEGLLVVEKMNFYYLSGTAQDGLLFIPLKGEPQLMIKRELERAKIESPIKNIIALKSIREIPTLIQTHCGKIPKNLGLELDVLPVKDYFKYQEFFPSARFVDASPMMRDSEDKVFL